MDSLFARQSSEITAKGTWLQKRLLMVAENGLLIALLVVGGSRVNILSCGYLAFALFLMFTDNSLGSKSHNTVIPFRANRYRLLMFYCLFVIALVVAGRMPIVQNVPLFAAGVNWAAVIGLPDDTLGSGSTAQLLDFGFPIVVVFTLCIIQTTIFNSSPFEQVLLYW
jgi:hypothetical protein